MGRKLRLVTMVLLFGGILIASIIWLTAEGSAKTMTVDDNEDANFSRIQDAINASEDGDIIRVFEGTYFENLVVNKSISISGNGSDISIIQPDTKHTVIQIRAAGVTISRLGILKIEHGFPNMAISTNFSNTRLSELKITRFDDGVRVISSNNNHFTNISFVDIHYSLHLGNSSYNIVEGNSFHDVEHGIRIESGSTNNTVSENLVEYRFRGIGLNSGCNSNFIDNNDFRDRSNDRGSAISLVTFSSENIVSNNTIYSNGVRAISLDNCDNNTFANNHIHGKAVGMYISRSRVNKVSYNIFKGQSVNHGIQLTGEADFNIISNNSISGYKNGVFIPNSETKFIDRRGVFNQIIHNTIENNENGILMNNPSPTTEIRHNIIRNNTLFGVNVTEADNVLMNLTYNSWGNESGPFHPVVNPLGTGNEISDNVEFDPWTDKKSDESNRDDSIHGFEFATLISCTSISIMYNHARTSFKKRPIK